MTKIYHAEDLPQPPWWIIGLQLLALGPVAILAALAGTLQAAADWIEWGTHGRQWTVPFGNAASRIEAAWYRRQIKRLRGKD